MLDKPVRCTGCPLADLGEGFMKPSLSNGTSVKVALVGEALGQQEAEYGEPFVGKAGFKLTRLIEWAGFDRSQFDIWNVVWCRPPDNKLVGEWYERDATAHCRAAYWDELVSRVNVIVPMGNVPTMALTGRAGILKTRGYIRPGPGNTHVIPTVHPSFIQRGQAKYSAAFINDLQKAVRLSREGLQPTAYDYTIDPTPASAMAWAAEYINELNYRPDTKLAFDIETPGKKDDEGALDDDEDPTYTIWRIGFSYKPYHALSIPWQPMYIPAIRTLLESSGSKVVWNAGFDVPRIKHNGVGINGVIHDGMVAWHVLHSDLPKGLGFVATFTCPHQEEWKHLSGSQPGFYNATDADVELRSMLHIEDELRKCGLWEVYDRDVVQLEPVLMAMSRAGMPIDPNVRLDRAIKLDLRQREITDKMNAVIPEGVVDVVPKEGYVKQPDDITGLVAIRVEATVRRCSRCGEVNPRKPHFKTYKRPTAKRPQNPCAGADVNSRTESVLRYAKPKPFKPSRTGLIRYQKILKRPVPQKWDKKAKVRKDTMDEKAIRALYKKYPDDPLYPLVLEYRKLDKIAGTYIGRPVEC